MEILQEMQHILTTIIAVMATLTGMGFVFNILLTPLKDNQARIEKRMDQFEAKLDQLLAQKNS